MSEQNTVYDVVGIGNAIVDVLAKVGDTFLKERDLTKGCMTLVEAAEAGKIYNDIIPEREVSGGSAANTVAGMASLGADCAFIGKVHDIVIVTPDAQRSMFTYLGASRKLSKDDIDEKLISESKIIFIEGYLWDEPMAHEAVLKACELAHKYGREVAFTVSDRYCVSSHRDHMLDLIKNHVDLLFANEMELKALFETEDFSAALDMVKPMVKIAAITRDSRGSVVVNGRVKIFVEAEPVKPETVVDSTGAGDLYAAGFLFGLVNKRSLGTCAMIGSIAASEIISHYGARPEVSLRGFVRNKLLQYGKRF